MSKTKFGPPCTICGHPARQVIEAKIIAGAPYREIATDHGINSIITLSRHINNGHMKAAVKAAKKAQKEKEADAGLNIMKCAKEIYKESLGLSKDARGMAKTSQDCAHAGTCLTQAVNLIGILTKVDAPLVDIHFESWGDAGLEILKAVDNDPEAKAKIIAALERERRSPVRPGSSDLE